MRSVRTLLGAALVSATVLSSGALAALPAAAATAPRTSITVTVHSTSTRPVFMDIRSQDLYRQLGSANLVDRDGAGPKGSAAWKWTGARSGSVYFISAPTFDQGFVTNGFSCTNQVMGSAAGVYVTADSRNPTRCSFEVADLRAAPVVTVRVKSTSTRAAFVDIRTMDGFQQAGFSDVVDPDGSGPKVGTWIWTGGADGTTYSLSAPWFDQGFRTDAIECTNYVSISDYGVTLPASSARPITCTLSITDLRAL